MPAAPASSPGLSVVIPSWEGRALLQKFLPSVVQSVDAFQSTCSLPAEIFVADDASSDDTPAWLRAHFPSVRCESSPTRCGFAPTVNRGVRAARYSAVYVLNNDVALEPDTLSSLLPHLSDPFVFAVTGQVHDFASGLLRGAVQLARFRRGFLGIHERLYVNASDSSPSAPFLTLWASGGSTLFDREKFLALGGFEELFAPFGWEDVELCLRAWKQGFTIHYEPRSSIWHQFSSTIGSRHSRRHVRAVYERNRLWAHWMHLDTPRQFAAHFSILFLKLLADPFAFRWETWSAFLQALRGLSNIRARRRDLLARRRVLLTSVQQLLAAQVHRPEAHPLHEETAPTRPCPYSPPQP